LLFAGQGSQYVGMAKGLVETYPAAAEMMRTADSVLGYALSEIMFNGPAETLTETRYTQPALFVHEAIALSLVRDNLSFDVVAGHSLGEYSALFAAGVLSFEDALRIVAVRARLMFESGTKRPGTMAAVVGLDDDTVRELCASLDNVDAQRLVAANFNAPGQVVISGSADYVRACMPKFKEAGAKLVKELQVSGAFHSPLLEDAVPELAAAINAAAFHDATVDVIVNVSAKPLRAADSLREAAIAQLTSSVQWTKTMETMSHMGVRTFTEIGPGKVLQGLVKRAVADATADGIDTVEDVERIVNG
jgi:[acyl-carrier-protein] S-malonyltransferase